MRRNKKCNIYTNRTIKRSPPDDYYGCECCKSFCKEFYLNNEQPDMKISGHYYCLRKKLHQIAIGSLLPGKTIIAIQRKRYRSRCIKNERLKNKRQVLTELDSDVLMSNFMRRVDLVTPHS